MAKHKVLSTKKLEPSLVELAKGNGIEITEQEFISIVPIISDEKINEVMQWVINNDLHYVGFTSANAVEALKKYLHQGDTWFIPNWNIFSLAGKTKDALNPFFKRERIFATAENAKDLAQEILNHNIQELIFFCGNKRRDVLPNILRDAGIKVHEVIVYETIETPVAATNGFDAILFFSPSAVQSFFSVNQLNKNAVCFAIGQTTANSIADFTDNKIIICESPSQEMMLASIKFYFQNKNCDE